MEESVEFTLLSISMLDYHFPPPNAKINVTADEVMWLYSLHYRISPFPNNRKFITIGMKFKLYRKNDPKKKGIASMEISNMFSVTAELSADTKLYVFSI